MSTSLDVRCSNEGQPVPGLCHALFLLGVVEVPSHLTLQPEPLDVPKYRESLRAVLGVIPQRPFTISFTART
jgi:hypothetical protein